MGMFSSHGVPFLLWGELINPCFMCPNDAFHGYFSFILLAAKIFKQSSHSSASAPLGKHLQN
jgi:hypothetical protein